MILKIDKEDQIHSVVFMLCSRRLVFKDKSIQDLIDAKGIPMKRDSKFL
jgi:hypothetical protein